MFDNDGTLWAEQPAYFQALFIRDRIQAMAPQQPQWQTPEPHASLLKADLQAVLAGREKALLQLAMSTRAGMTTDEFRLIVDDGITTARHPTTGHLDTEVTYTPMCAFAYDRPSHIGQLARGVDAAGARGWTVVSMKRDWRTVFAPAK